MGAVVPREQVDAARRARQLLAKFNKARDLIQLGAYAEGRDAELDAAVRLHGPLATLLQQDMHEPATLADSWGDLRALLGH
jgi:flagellum-specific ATP synthase